MISKQLVLNFGDGVTVSITEDFDRLVLPIHLEIGADVARGGNDLLQWNVLKMELTRREFINLHDAMGRFLRAE